MLNTKYPIDAVRVKDWWGTACTTTASDPITGASICTNQIQTILASTSPASGHINTILGTQNSGDRSVELDLFCDGILVREMNTQGFVYDAPIQNCTGDITWAFQSSLATDVWLEVAYVPYDIRTTSMATNTPFIVSSGYDNGTFYYHNPLIDIVGISIFLAALILFTWFIVKIFRKI